MERDHTTNGTSEFPAVGIMKTSEVIVTSTEEALSSGRPDSAQVQKKASFLNTANAGRPTTQSKVYRPSGGIDPNKAAVKYCKCAMLFFIALIITWVPSTVNRIYTIVRPDKIIFGLNLAAALVLPLQGFWNAVIYMATSNFAVKSLWEDICHLCQRQSSNMISMQVQRHDGADTTNDLGDRASKFSSSSHPYDPERSSSQSELVGQAK